MSQGVLDESDWIKVNLENGELSGLRYVPKRGFLNIQFPLNQFLTTQNKCLYPKNLVLNKPPTIGGNMHTKIKDMNIYALGFKGKKIKWCIFYQQVTTLLKCFKN